MYMDKINFLQKMTIIFKNTIKNIVKHEICLIMWLTVWDSIRIIMFINLNKFQNFSPLYLKRKFLFLMIIIVLVYSIIQQIIKEIYKKEKNSNNSKHRR